MSENKKLDITSTVLEKGIDIAKSFLEKLIFPAVEETGLLIKDKITFWKFKNQVKMLNKAQQFCLNNNIEPKSIPFKIISPMLEYSAMEENEKLQDKWAILLSNMVDSEQNIENHVFPYILSQISINEYEILETVYLDVVATRKQAKIDLEKFQNELEHVKSELTIKIDEKRTAITKLKESQGRLFSDEIWKVQQELRELESRKNNFWLDEWKIKSKINMAAIVPDDSIEEFELANIIRLGLVEKEKDVFANSQNLEIPVGNSNEYGYLNYKLEIEMDSVTQHRITQLGEMFIDACTEKKVKI